MKRSRTVVLIMLAALFMVCLSSFAVAQASVSGAIFTTIDAAGAVNANQFDDKEHVYLNGGPHHIGASGLPEGAYYVQVTEPDGTVLGSSTNAPDEADWTPAVVGSDGKFVEVYGLWDIVWYANGDQGYEDTSNGGGVYKVWISRDPDFDQNDSKTDNFRVVGGGGTQDEITGLIVEKFYDANGNGEKDSTEPFLLDWKININDEDFWTTYDEYVDPGTYAIFEYKPDQACWRPTTPTSVSIDIDADTTETVQFGNLCIGSGGGLTLGFWSNKNGQSLIGSTDLGMLTALNLRNLNGTAFDPASNTAFKNWILAAKAENMANMLSAQLAAMELNVFNGKVNGSSLVWLGDYDYEAYDFDQVTTINDLMAAADASLAVNGNTPSGNPDRAYQEFLKTALDDANNNKTFVQASPGLYTFDSNLEY